MIYGKELYPISDHTVDGDFVALDFETINVKAGGFFGDEINLRVPCQIGLVSVCNNIIDETKSLNLNIKPIGIEECYPINEFSLSWLRRNTNIISSKETNIIPSEIWKDCPTFEKVWPTICEIIGDKPIIAHMAEVEKSTLINACEHYGIEMPKAWKFVCTKRVSEQLDYHYFNKIIVGAGMRTLTTCCTRYGVSFSEEEHHDAYADAKATACLMLKMREGIKPLSFEDYETIDFPEINDKPLLGRQIVLTGQMSILQEKKGIKYRRYLTHEERETRLKNFLSTLGAKFTKTASISKNIDILLCGQNAGWAKVAKVKELQAKGCNIEILFQDTLDKIIANKAEAVNVVVEETNNNDIQPNPFVDCKIAILGTFKYSSKTIKDKFKSYGAKINSKLTKTCRYAILGSNLSESQKQNLKDVIDWRGYDIRILHEDDLDNIFAGRYEGYYTEAEVKKNLHLTYEHYLDPDCKLTLESMLNSLLEKNVYLPKNLRGNRLLLAQVIGNIGAYANNEIVNESESDKTKPVILLTDDTIRNLQEGREDDDIRYIQDVYNASRADGLSYKFIAESELIAWIRERCQQCGDEQTMSMLNDFISTIP